MIDSVCKGIGWQNSRPWFSYNFVVVSPNYACAELNEARAAFLPYVGTAAHAGSWNLTLEVKKEWKQRWLGICYNKCYCELCCFRFRKKWKIIFSSNVLCGFKLEEPLCVRPHDWTLGGLVRHQQLSTCKFHQRPHVHYNYTHTKSIQNG